MCTWAVMNTGGLKGKMGAIDLQKRRSRPSKCHIIRCSLLDDYNGNLDSLKTRIRKRAGL